jgi:hypothetical protein
VNADLPVSVESSSGLSEEGEPLVRERVWVMDLRGRRHLAASLSLSPEEARHRAQGLLECARKAEELAESSARLRGRKT